MWWCYAFIGERKPRLAGWGLLCSPLHCLTQALFKVPGTVAWRRLLFPHAPTTCCAKTAIYKFYTSERGIYMRVGMYHIVVFLSLQLKGPFSYGKRVAILWCGLASTSQPRQAQSEARFRVKTEVAIRTWRHDWTLCASLLLSIYALR